MNFSTERISNQTVIRHSSFVIASRGLTLIEMLVGLAITLVMMAAVVNLFANIGGGVKLRQASMEMGGQIRIARAQLYNDLTAATCRALPWRHPADAEGYIEIVEGLHSDKQPSAQFPKTTADVTFVPSSQEADPVTDVVLGLDGMGLGDYDDILALTVRSELAPFTGRALDTAGSTITIESSLAEVIWYAVENPDDRSLGEPGMRSVYRRELLIAPWVEPIDLTILPGGIAADDATRFYQRYDISARFDNATNKWIPNSLSDLTKRENRFAHFFDNAVPNRGYPHALLQDSITPNASSPAFPAVGATSPLHPFGLPFEWDPADPNPADPTLPPTTDRQGEDLMLNDVLAFDVRVFDPGAPLYDSGVAIVGPSDFGWDITYLNIVNEPADGDFDDMVGQGAYVDLGYGTSAGVSPFPNNPLLPAPQPLRPAFDDGTAGKLINGSAVYDTWSFHYENDGLNQDGDTNPDGTPLIDEGTNGLDDDGINGVDDIGERETAPPYDVPLRGMQVKLRIYETETRQIREATVTRSFVQQ